MFCSARVPLGDELRPIGNFVIGDAIAGTRQRDDDAIARDFDVEITSTWDWRGFAASRSQAFR